MIAAPAFNLDNLLVYPNPFKPNAGNIETGTWDNGIIFGNLPADTKIEIFTITGDKLLSERLTAGGNWKWDVKNSDGEKVASGIYVYLVRHGTDKKTGRLVVIK